jgi:predicted SPOUT superfamily RNA methylase MTH1
MDLSTRTLIRFDVPPLRVDPLQQQLFFGHLGRMILILRVNRIYLIEQREKATKLIKFLESKYHL